MLRHGDRVTVGCQAQLVNVIGLLRSEPGGPAWKQTIAHPFERVRHCATGQILQLVTTSDRYETPSFGDVDLVDASGTWDEETGVVSLFVANRDLDEHATVDVALGGFGPLRLTTAHTLCAADGQDRHTTNTAEQPDRVGLRSLDDVVVDGSAVQLRLPPCSWSVVQLSR